MANIIHFFAYDELMFKEEFAKKGLEANASFTVTLSAYKMVFNKIPNGEDIKEGAGLPNIVPTDGNLGMMEGVLYEMKDSYLAKLDEIYGHPDNYQRQKMRFVKHDFSFVNGIVYMAPKALTDDELLPSKDQLKSFKRAKKILTMLYFSRMMTQATVEEPNRRRI